jgi:hypothetical protein
MSEQRGNYALTRQRTVNFVFSTNAFCFSTESALTPMIRVFARLKFSFSLNVCNWQTSLVHPHDPASKPLSIHASHITHNVCRATYRLWGRRTARWEHRTTQLRSCTSPHLSPGQRRWELVCRRGCPLCGLVGYNCEWVRRRTVVASSIYVPGCGQRVFIRYASIGNLYVNFVLLGDSTIDHGFKECGKFKFSKSHWGCFSCHDMKANSWFKWSE